MVSNRSGHKYPGTTAGPIQKHGLLRHAATVTLGGKSVASPFRRGRNGSTAPELGRLPVFPGYCEKKKKKSILARSQTVSGRGC